MIPSGTHLLFGASYDRGETVRHGTAASKGHILPATDDCVYKTNGIIN